MSDSSKKAGAEKRVIRSTTILSVMRNGMAVMAGDGQVTEGATVLKGSAGFGAYIGACPAEITTFEPTK